MYRKAAPLLEARTAERCCSDLIPHLRPNMTILDVGCGPGSITVGLARLVPQGRVVGLDIWPEALDTARAAATARGVTNVSFYQGSVFDMQAALGAAGERDSAPFDVVHAHMVLMHLTEPVRAIEEMRKVAKADGGIVAIADLAGRMTFPESAAMKANSEIFEKAAKDRGIHLDGGRYNHVWAHEAGFPWERIVSSTASYEHAGKQGRKAWVTGIKESLRGNVVKGGYATEEELDQHAAAWEDWQEMGEGRHVTIDGRVLCWN